MNQIDGQALDDRGGQVDAPPPYNPNADGKVSCERRSGSPRARALARANGKINRREAKIEQLRQRLSSESQREEVRVAGINRDLTAFQEAHAMLLELNGRLSDRNTRLEEAFRQVRVEPPPYTETQQRVRNRSYRHAQGKSRSRSPITERKERGEIQPFRSAQRRQELFEWPQRTQDRPEQSERVRNAIERMFHSWRDAQDQSGGRPTAQEVRARFGIEEPTAEAPEQSSPSPHSRRPRR